MSLLAIAEADNAIILEDTVDGFGVPATFHPPTGPDVVVGVQYIRIGQRMDPATGLPVVGDTASVTARISSLGATMPTDGWTVAVADSTGATITYKIDKGRMMEDRTAGRVTWTDLKKVG